MFVTDSHIITVLRYRALGIIFEVTEIEYP